MSTGQSTSPRRSRYRGDIGLAMLFFGLVAGPVAWAAQLIVIFALASRACFPAGKPEIHLGSDAVWPTLLAVNLIAIAIALAAAGASYRNWRVADVEELRIQVEIRVRVAGRSRFLAGWGALAGLGFCAGAILNTIALFLVPSCFE
jgi:hypothetical protein